MKSTLTVPPFWDKLRRFLAKGWDALAAGDTGRQPLTVRIITGRELHGPFCVKVGSHIHLYDQGSEDGLPAAMQVSRPANGEVTITLRTVNYAQPNLREAGEKWRAR